MNLADGLEGEHGDKPSEEGLHGGRALGPYSEASIELGAMVLICPGKRRELWWGDNIREKCEKR